MGNMKKISIRFIQYACLLFASFIVLFPPYIMVINAFKGNEEYAKTSVFDWPQNFLNFENFRVVFEVGGLGRAFGNTAILIVVSVALNVLLGTMIAYVLGRFEFRLKKGILGAYVLAKMIPLITVQVATFGLIKSLGLFNTFYAPILLYVGADVMQIYLYLQFIRNVPYELDESAMIEGATLLQIYRKIIFPLLAPATATLVILKTASIYNDMYTPFLYMPSQHLGTVSTSLMRFVGENSAQWNVLCAAILIILIPTIVLYLFLQRYIFSGITSGAVK
ncbi:carbohydrate ABC transporter permease [Paenibacillus sp. KQZ6P-2]|uniref:Carbohydrate ABC transporter permease n=1 Tax=Paenibacillus mangrovi TaxID=2931978 RepID=A0A9X2B658_9BACL|nr:carbohydrate ABC transporter permease [Paenibacillus mangrovi]MCJ8013487.1 carbohydrate ABC transporter permease [Paenibacillus mangrovi]